MPTNLHIDAELLSQAVALSGGKTKRATVEEALREYVAYLKQIKVLDLAGKIEFANGCDPLSLRQKERLRERSRAKKLA